MPKRRARVSTMAAAAVAASVAGVMADGPANLPHGRLGRHRRAQDMSMSMSLPLVVEPVPTMNPTPVPLPTTSAPTKPLCSCSPREYEFEINLDGRCRDDTIGDTAGIDGSICFYARGDTPSSADDIEFPGGRRGLRVVESKYDADAIRDGTNEKWERMLERAFHSSHVEHAESILRQRRAQDFDTVPTVITSVTFLEADSTAQLNIINQNSEYFNATLTDGDTIVFPSISAQLNESMSLYDQIDTFPGGVMLVLYGINEDDVVVQNVVAWGYKLDECGAVPLQSQERIGWVNLVDSKPPRAQFCPAVTDMPTAFPSGSPTTAGPTSDVLPTMKPTVFSMELTAAPTPGFDKSEMTHKPTPPRIAKSSKGTKSAKSSKGAKGAKGAKGDMSMLPEVYQLFPKSAKKTHGYQLFPKSAKKHGEGYGEGMSLYGKASSQKGGVYHAPGAKSGKEMEPYALFPKSAKNEEKSSAKAEKEGLFPKSGKEKYGSAKSGKGEEESMSYYGGKSSKRAKATKSSKGWASKAEGTAKSSKEGEGSDYGSDDGSKSAKATAEGAYALFHSKSAKSKSGKGDAKADKESSSYEGGAKAAKLFKPKSAKASYDYESKSAKATPGSVQVARPPIGGTPYVPRPTPSPVNEPTTPRPTNGSSELSASQIDEIEDDTEGPTPAPSNMVGGATSFPTVGVETPATGAPTVASVVANVTTAAPTVGAVPTAGPTNATTATPTVELVPALPAATPSPTAAAVPVDTMPPTTVVVSTSEVERTTSTPPTTTASPSTHYPTYVPTTHYPTYTPTVEEQPTVPATRPPIGEAI